MKQEPEQQDKEEEDTDMTKTTKKRGRPAKKMFIEKTDEEVAEKFLEKAEADPLNYPEITEVKVYRLCPNPRFVMAIPCVNGVPDMSQSLMQVECPRKVRDKLLGKIVKVANVGCGSHNYYHYVK
jgi:hypothetical protein